MIGTRKAVITAAGALGVVALLAGCTSGSNTSENAPTAGGGTGDVDWSSIEPVELTVSSIFPTGNTASNLLEGWMTAVEDATEGVVTFDYYQNGTLHPATEALSAMTSGLTDVTFVSNGYFPDQLPVSNWDDITVQEALSDFGYPNTNIAGIGQQIAHYEGESAALDEMRNAGFIPMLPMLSGPAALTCSKEFHTPEDLEGRQVRVANAIAQGENESLGMGGVFTASNEQYEALQRGVVDCAVNAVTVVLSGGLLEVSPWVSMLSTAPTSGSNWVVSTLTWDTLAPEIQQAMKDARYEPLSTFAQQTLDQYTEVIAASEKAGGGIIDPSDLNPTVKEWWSDQPAAATIAPDSVADPDAEVARTNDIATAWWDFSIEDLKVETDHDDIVDALDLGSGVVADWDAWTDALRKGVGTE